MNQFILAFLIFIVCEFYTVDSPSFGKYSCILVCEFYTVGLPDLSQSIAVLVLLF